METYKLIRKICLWLTAIGLIVALGYAVFEEYVRCFSDGYNRCVPNPLDDLPLAIIMIIVAYIGVYILFEIISKIIESVKKDTSKMKVFSDKQYLEAYSEVEENNIQNKELWAKAFAQCGGDKEKQKSIYVELRTKELSKG
jgi:hypothetical protein